MGYTHYYRQKPKLDKVKFSAFASDCKEIIKAAQARGITLVAWDGEGGDPVATDEKVSFNGLGDEAHESFVVTPESEISEWGKKDGETMAFNFCKTAYKPYDAVVCACLVSLQNHFGDDVKISSDGNEEDWDEGKRLYTDVTGREVSNILDREDE